MLSGLIRLSIRYHGIVMTLAALLLAYGGFRIATAGLDLFPEFAPKKVIIQTEAPGLSPGQVEVLISRPIELAIAGLANLQLTRSESIQGLSVVTATFDEASDLFRNRQLVSERLANLPGRLPATAGPPVVLPLSSSSATVLTLGLNANDGDLLNLRTVADWTIVPRLLAIPGVADVNVFGGGIKQLQIQVNPLQLQRFNTGLNEVIQAVSEAIRQRGSGFVETDNQRMTLQLTGLPVSPVEFEQLVIKREHGQNITLAQLASVGYGPEPPFSAAQIQGEAGIILMVIGQYGANTLSVSRRIEQALEALQPLFKQQGISLHPHLFRPADYIETSVNKLSGHLLLGGLFVLITLYAFLFNLRTAIIAALAIPLSLVGAIVVLLEYGVNLNVMVLGGLAIALGEVVDDAIIDTENIFRRLRQNHQSATPLPADQVIHSASLEVRGSVVYASFIVALVFVPLLTLDGIAGRLFAPLGQAYILAILMSLLTALILTPALSYLLLTAGKGSISDPPLMRFIKPLYHNLLRWVIKHFRVVALCCFAICLASLAAIPGFSNKFLPELREGHFMVHTASVPGTSLQESLRIGRRLTAEFLKIPGVQSVSQWAGRAERGADTYGSHYSEYEIGLTKLNGQQQQAVSEQLRGTLAGFPGLNYEANTFLTERIDETISGYTAPVVVNIFGDDLATLDRQAQAIAGIMQGIDGAADIQVRAQPSTPKLDITLDVNQLNFFGVNPGHASQVIQAAYETYSAGKIIQNGKTLNVGVTLPEPFRHQAEALGQLPLQSQDGHLVWLEQVAQISHGDSRYNILHQNGLRLQTVTCKVVNRDMGGFISELKTKLHDDINFTGGSYPEFTGAAIEQAQAKQNLVLHALMAGVGVIILIYLAIGNLRQTLLTLANLPFALTGGVIAVAVTGSPLSVGSIVGFITLFGITVRNSIMLLSHYRQLTEIEGRPWGFETALLGAQERLPSILMTALVTALAMLPIAINSDNPGREIMGPMAAIITGGLVSSTLLNLLLLPGLLLHFSKAPQAL